MTDTHDAHWTEVEEAVELLAEGSFAQAAAELGRIAAASPRNEYAHFYLGTAHFELDDYERALAAYVKALEVVPTYLAARLAAAQCLRLMGRHEQALRMGRAVLEQRKDDPDALHLCGMVCFSRGEYAAAQAYLERFLHTNPELEVALEVEGMLQLMRGEARPLEQDED